MPWQHFVAVGWCECAVTLVDTGDGSVALAPRSDASRHAELRCACPVPRSKGRPSPRWIRSRLCPEADPGSGFEWVRSSCRRPHSLPASHARRRSMLLPSRFAECCWLNRGPRVSALECFSAGYRPDAVDALAHDNSAAEVGRDPNAVCMNLHGCSRLRHACCATRATRFSSRHSRSATLRDDQIGADCESSA